MLKKITALKPRLNLGQLRNKVALKEDDYIIERAGKALVVVISIDKYKRFEREKNEFFDWVDKVRERTKDVDPKIIEKAVDEAVAAVRKSKRKITM